MKSVTRALKEDKILKAAKKIFEKKGEQNAKMEDIASKAGITKVTLYSYFKSKDNLCLAVTLGGYSILVKQFEKTLKETESQSGKESVLELFKVAIDFFLDNPVYLELFLKTSGIIGIPKQSQDLDLDKLDYYQRLRDMYIMPFKISRTAFEKGKSDGSIKCPANPYVLTVAAWNNALGYVQHANAVGTSKQKAKEFRLKELKEFHIYKLRKILEFQTMELPTV